MNIAFTSLYKVISELEANGTVVVLLAIHDPSRIAPAPKSIKCVLLDRALQVNAALRWAMSKTNAVLIETIDREEIYDRKNWHIDRMHPGPRGHQILADLVRRELSLPRRSKEKLPTKHCSLGLILECRQACHIHLSTQLHLL